ncbi:MAG: hypothetical protein LBH04_00815, partial [Tannerellaceae bacterium]|nr:hypothetical protein [Tannerellaceae bacterium]
NFHHIAHRSNYFFTDRQEFSSVEVRGIVKKRVESSFRQSMLGIPLKWQLKRLGGGLRWQRKKKDTSGGAFLAFVSS